MKTLIHVNSPLTAIVALSYIDQKKEHSEIYVTISRIKSLSNWFLHLDNVRLVGGFSETDLCDLSNTLIVPHDYVDNEKYVKYIHRGNIKNVHYIEEGDLSWLGSRYHPDRKRIFNIKKCNIPIVGKMFDKMVFSRDQAYITLSQECFNFASNKKKIIVNVDRDTFEFYPRFFTESSKVVLAGTYTYEKDISNFQKINKEKTMDFYIKPHPLIFRNKILLKKFNFYLKKNNLSDRIIDRADVSLELESLFSKIEIYGAETSIQRYEKFFPYKFFSLS